MPAERLPLWPGAVCGGLACRFMVRTHATVWWEMFSVSEEDRSSPRLEPSPEIDTTVSHSARIWDYWLGGKDNYPVDREVGDRIEEMLPDIAKQAREDRK